MSPRFMTGDLPKVIAGTAYAALVAVHYHALGALGAMLITSASLLAFYVYLRIDRRRQETKQRLDALVQALPDAVLLLQPDGRVLDVNRAALELYGYSREEFIGMTLVDLRPPSDRALVAAGLSKTIADGAIRLDAVHRRKDGRLFPVEVRAAVARWGERPVIQSVIRDVTRHREAADRIKTLTRLYKTLAACNSIMMHADGRDALLDRLCRTLVTEGGFSLAQVWWHDPASDSLRSLAAHGKGAEDSARYRPPVHPAADAERSLVAEAFRTRAPSYSGDLQRDSRVTLASGLVHRHGLNGALCQPVTAGGAVVGVLSLVSTDPAFFVEEVAALVATLASDLGWALDNLVVAEEAATSTRALNESRHLLSQITGTLPMFLFVLDVRTKRLVYASRQIRALLGYSPEELSRMVDGGPPPFVHPDDRPALEAVLGLACSAEDGGPHEHTHRVRHADGTWRWHKVRFTVFARDKEGQPERLLGVVEDVTSSVESRSELAHLSADLRRVAQAVANAAESIVITDGTGVIQYVNPALERVSGYAAAEVLGRHIRVLKSGRQDAAFYRELWATISAGKVWHGHFVNKRKDGTLFEEDASIAPVKDGGGNITNYVAVKRDVTKELSLEEQLRQAQKLEAVGRLAGGVAHDFNNILTSIIGYAQMALDASPEGSQLRSDLDEVEKGARRAANLTRQLLIFSRKQVVRPRLVDPAQVVGDLQKMLRRIIGETHPLRFVAETQGTRILVDPSQLEQVVMNFVVNSRDAMPKGGEIEVSVLEARLPPPTGGIDGPIPPGAYVALSVKDSGGGIPAEVLPRIFEPFFTTKPLGEGTGLGLSTVYGIVKQAGGYLVVETAVGVGTTMAVYWPAAVPLGEGEAVQEASAAGGGRETILVVEDDAPLRALTARILEAHGYRVSQAEDARAALEQAAAGAEWRLILTDVVLPGGKSGLELAESLRRDRPGQKVLLMSGHAEDLSRPDLEGPRLPFLQKPFTRAALLEAVRAALDTAAQAFP